MPRRFPDESFASPRAQGFRRTRLPSRGNLRPEYKALRLPAAAPLSKLASKKSNPTPARLPLRRRTRRPMTKAEGAAPKHPIALGRKAPKTQRIGADSLQRLGPGSVGHEALVDEAGHRICQVRIGRTGL